MFTAALEFAPCRWTSAFNVHLEARRPEGVGASCTRRTIKSHELSQAPLVAMVINVFVHLLCVFYCSSETRSLNIVSQLFLQTQSAVVSSYRPCNQAQWFGRLVAIGTQPAKPQSNLIFAIYCEVHEQRCYSGGSEAMCLVAVNGIYGVLNYCLYRIAGLNIYVFTLRSKALFARHGRSKTFLRFARVRKA